MELNFVYCDYSNEYHCERFVGLINQYLADPMGEGKPLTRLQQLQLVDGMANHPAGFVLFAVINEEIVGLATCFINFSTFKAKPYLNIHDIIVQQEFRGFGIGRFITEKCIKIAQEHKYCKVTLEVRDDNSRAQKIYKSLGFKDSDPVMHFWTKEL